MRSSRPDLTASCTPARQLGAVPRDREVGIPRGVAAQLLPRVEETVEPLAPIAERPDERDDGTIRGPVQRAARRHALVRVTSGNRSGSEP